MTQGKHANQGRFSKKTRAVKTKRNLLLDSRQSFNVFIPSLSLCQECIALINQLCHSGRSVVVTDSDAYLSSFSYSVCLSVCTDVIWS